MAKKKINIKSVTSDVPSGDVNITYKNVRIAGLSESTTAVLETEDTICEDDIEVEYIKSAAGLVLPYFTVTNNSSVPNEDISITFTAGFPCSLLNGNLCNNIINLFPEYILPETNTTGTKYHVHFAVSTESDIFNITCNGDVIPYENNNYNMGGISETYPTGYNIVINDKSQNN